MLPEPIPFGDFDPLGATFVPSVGTTDKAVSASKHKNYFSYKIDFKTLFNIQLTE